MLYRIRMDVRVPHALASKQLERLKAEEKARAQGCSATAGGGTCGLLRGNTRTMTNHALCRYRVVVGEHLARFA